MDFVLMLALFAWARPDISPRLPINHLYGFSSCTVYQSRQESVEKKSAVQMCNTCVPDHGYDDSMKIMISMGIDLMKMMIPVGIACISWRTQWLSAPRGECQASVGIRD